MPLYDLKCPTCSNWRRDALVPISAETMPKCDLCATVMEKLVSLPAQAVYGPGRSAESRATYNASTKAKLEARSNTYDAKGKGKAERDHQIEKLKASGVIPT